MSWPVKTCLSPVSAGVPGYFTRTTRPVPLSSKTPAGTEVHLPKCERPLASRSVSRRARAFCAAALSKGRKPDAGTVMERSHTPLSTWFWGAYLIASQTPECRLFNFSGSSVCRAMRRPRYLHKLRAGMVRPERDKIGGKPKNMSKWMKLGSEDGPAAKAGASITRFSSLAPWSASPQAGNQARQSERRSLRGRVRLAVRPRP